MIKNLFYFYQCWGADTFFHRLWLPLKEAWLSASWSPFYKNLLPALALKMLGFRLLEVVIRGFLLALAPDTCNNNPGSSSPTLIFMRLLGGDYWAACKKSSFVWNLIEILLRFVSGLKNNILKIREKSFMILDSILEWIQESSFIWLSNKNQGNLPKASH